MPGETLDPVSLFDQFMKITGVPRIGGPAAGGLAGKRLGVVNGAVWINLWISYFGARFLPGVQLISAANDAVQLNFMRAHREGRPCPPAENIALFRQYAEQLVELQRVDAVLLTCSTMNRAVGEVREALTPLGVPVVQIDEAMMEQAVEHGGTILVVATHGPTVGNTLALLRETAERIDRRIRFTGVTVERAFERLGAGDVRGHNAEVAAAIRAKQGEEKVDIVVLAQLSMTIFKLSHPRPEEDFGVPVLTSGETGFLRVRDVLLSGHERSGRTSGGDRP